MIRSKTKPAVTITIYQLPTRFVVVEGHVDQHGQHGHTVHPVLGWQVLVENGDIDHEPLFFHDGGVTALNDARRFYNGPFELVPCDWSEAEDAAQLADVFRTVEADALKQARRVERRIVA